MMPTNFWEGFKVSFLKEFKEFAFKGNVLDMAVGVIIGTSFGKIVTSVVSDLIMPIFTSITSGVKFTDIVIKLRGDNAILIGNFIQNVVDFLIIAASIFVFIKAINRFKKKEEIKEPEPAKPTQEELLAEIRDLLKEKQ